jgi:uncharacterized protein YbjT (DUF2867 family)
MATEQEERRRRLLVLGATGRIGREVVRLGLEEGYAVRVLVREVVQLDPRVEVQVGDPLEAEAARRAVDGVTDIVIALGLRRKSESMWAPLTSPPDVVARAARAVVEGTRGRGVRVVTISAHGVRESWHQMKWLARVVVRVSQIRHSYADHAAQETVLEQSGLPCLVLRPTMLTDDASAACEVVANPGALRMTASVSRLAVAHSVVSALRDFSPGIVTLSRPA